MIALYILTFTILGFFAVISVFSESFKMQVLIIAFMYLFYGYLWYGFIFYQGKPAWQGFEMFMSTIFTAPFYIIFHLIAIFVSIKSGARKIMYLNMVGLALCNIHLVYVFS